jgi:hypothetical protein
MINRKSIEYVITERNGVPFWVCLYAKNIKMEAALAERFGRAGYKNEKREFDAEKECWIVSINDAKMLWNDLH